MQIEKYISNDIKPLQGNDSVATALEIMEDLQLSGLVAKIEEDWGIFEEETLLSFDDRTLLSSIPLKNPNSYLKKEDSLFKAGNFLIKSEASICPVLEEDQYLGYVLADEIYKAFSHQVFEQEGDILILKVLLNSYNLSDISRLLEYEGLKINFLHIFDQEGDLLSILLRLNKAGAEVAVAVLKRYGYEAFVLDREAEAQDLNAERYGLLMKYLNI